MIYLILYNILFIFIFLFMFPFILSNLIENKQEYCERFGIMKFNRKHKKTIWLHSASVGELKLAELLIKNLYNLYPEYSFFVSVITPAAKELGKKLTIKTEKIFYLPFDFILFLRKIFKMFYPNILILVETELWPGLILYSKIINKNTKIVLVNGRISDKSFKVYYFLKFFFKYILNKIDLFLMREDSDYRNILKLGVNKEKVFLTGNMKFDLINLKEKIQPPDYISEIKNYWKKIFIAASIREGEENIIVDVYSKIKKEIQELKLIFVPRHLNKIKTIETILKEKDIKYIKRTNISNRLNFIKDIDVLLVDTIGELLYFYSISDVIFVGGSLLKKFKGHNIIEPASLCKLVIFGQYIESFKEIANLLKKNNVGFEVKSSKELEEKLLYFLNNPEICKEIGKNAKKIIQANQGIVYKNIEYIENFL